MSTILSNVGLIVASSVEWLGDFAGVITATGENGDLANPIIFVFVAIGLSGIGVGFLKRLMRL